MTLKDIDLLVIGGGPAGYSAAIRGSQLGKKVILVEKKSLGGTCLNVGCIPTKSLLESSGFYEKVIKKSHMHGISIANIEMNYGTIIERKDSIVQTLVRGLSSLIKQKGITVLSGEAYFKSSQVVSVGDTDIKADKIIIATGTKPASLPSIQSDGKRILNSDHLLNLTKLPNSLLVIGGGVIGCEFANIYSSLGIDVTIVEIANQLLPTEDQEVSRTLLREFKKKKINVLTAAVINDMEITDNGLNIMLSQKDKSKTIRADCVLLAVGRQPVIPKGIDLELDKGYIKVDESYSTSENNIFAAGDVIGGYQLAHLAFEEGISAVNYAYSTNELERKEKYVPRCIYTSPEIASVGLTEKEAKEKFTDIKVSKFHLKANGKALILDENSGFCKIISDSAGLILGVHIIGPQATEMIAQGVFALQEKVKLEQWSQVIHPHPTVNESLKEAVLNGLGIGLHV